MLSCDLVFLYPCFQFWDGRQDVGVCEVNKQGFFCGGFQTHRAAGGREPERRCFPSSVNLLSRIGWHLSRMPLRQAAGVRPAAARCCSATPSPHIRSISTGSDTGATFMMTFEPVQIFKWVPFLRHKRQDVCQMRTRQCS